MAGTSLVRERGGFDRAFAVISDWDMWLRIADRPAAAIDEPLVALSVAAPALASRTATS